MDNTNTPYFKLLYAYQGDTTLCFLKDPTISEEDYIHLLSTSEYQAFLTQIKARFEQHLDTTLIAEQAAAYQDLQRVRNGTLPYTYLKDISKHWLDTLKLTTPILERLNAQARQQDELSNLKLVILPPDVSLRLPNNE